MAPILLGLLQAAPALFNLFDSGGDSIKDKAVRAASEVAQAVTGKGSDDEALTALQADPALMLEYQKAATERSVTLYQEETKRLQAINKTIRAEAASSDKYVRRMRPTWGYVMCITWAAQMLSVAYVIVDSPNDAPAVINALLALQTMWTVGLSVLGLYVWKRSEDKKPDAGGFGVLSAIAKRISGK
jgi:hypothetical protein